MTKEEVDTVMGWANSCVFPLEGLPNGVTRIQAFLAIKRLLKGCLYWYALKEAYTGCDNLFDYKADIKKAFEENEPYRSTLMNDDERKYFDLLPEQITIYRGMTKAELRSRDFGISWTLRKEIAEFFAFEYNRNFKASPQSNVVHELTINKSEIMAFFNEREEFELIYICKR